ncbi:S-adenosyl-L-methionine-dependent methyltransferase [Hortaea werneckii]|nr:S-adenosyl-L-methionine-dependent methyltransferase [Hortaea werneckii]
MSATEESKDEGLKGEDYEEQHVHEVYEQIASHFSSTRYKPWPIIERFLNTLPPGSVGLDVGCGNGKYLAVNPNIYILGSDRSTNLTRIAKTRQPHSALVADILDLPHAHATFDFAISIAVIHHLSTPARRREAIASILDTLKPAGNFSQGEEAEGEGCEEGGKALLYCWALEQERSRRGWSEGDEQDVMVPWVMRASKGTKGKGKGQKKKKEEGKEGEERVSSSQPTGESEGAAEGGDKTFHRYYHLYRQGELEEDVRAAGGEVVEGGYEKDNWWAIAIRR